MKTEGKKTVVKKGKTNGKQKKKGAPMKMKKKLSAVSTNEFFDQDFENAMSEEEIAETGNENAGELKIKIHAILKHYYSEFFVCFKNLIIQIHHVWKMIHDPRISFSYFFGQC